MMIGMVIIFMVVFHGLLVPAGRIKMAFQQSGDSRFLHWYWWWFFSRKIRGGLAQIGHTRFMRRFVKNESEQTIDKLVSGAKRLSELRYGGLIVIENQVGLKENITTGLELNAEVSSDLFDNNFYTLYAVARWCGNYPQ